MKFQINLAKRVEKFEKNSKKIKKGIIGIFSELMNKIIIFVVGIKIYLFNILSGIHPFYVILFLCKIASNLNFIQ